LPREINYPFNWETILSVLYIIFFNIFKYLQNN